jgi:acyl-CoA hydrolase
MPTIRETRNRMIQFVFPEYANNLGTLHGGRLMDWIMLVGSITSSRLVKGITVLGATDSIDFMNPVKIGEIVVLDSWVEYVGNSSLEVGVKVHSENPETGEKKLTTSSHLAFVAIARDGAPRLIPEKISPADRTEEAIYLTALKRREARFPRIAHRRKMADYISDETETSRYRLETTRPVLPEDSFYGNFMSVGKLMKDIDEVAAILASRFVRGAMVTGSVDDLYFYSPIIVGEVITFKAAITYVGGTSLEIGIKVLSENLETGQQKHTCTAFLTFVHIEKDGRPGPVPKFTPESPHQVRLWREAEERKMRRGKRVTHIKNLSENPLMPGENPSD